MKIATTVKSLLALTCTVALVGCGGETESDPQPDKREIAEQLAAGKADAMVDWCAEFDWYDDGICDDFCLQPDPDCDTGDGYEPCGDLSCGDMCSVCSPDDADCFETAVIKMCQPDGSCAASTATCDGESGESNNNGGYDPCEGLACGDSCSVCAPNDPDCVETADLKYCQADGVCMGVQPDTCDPSGVYDPCAGKTCGDTCNLCAPDDDDCFETLSIKECNDEGVCSDTLPVCQ